MIYSLTAFILGIVMFAVTIGCLIGSIVDPDHDPEWLYGIVIPFFIGEIFFSVAFSRPNPTVESLKEGKAEYQEVLYITGNDTVKEYKLVWREDVLKK